MKPVNGGGSSVNAGNSSVDPSAEGRKDYAATERENSAPTGSEISSNSQVEIGDVWWIPEQFNGYPGGKGRFCLVVALETSRGLTLSVRAHFVLCASTLCSGFNQTGQVEERSP